MRDDVFVVVIQIICSVNDSENRCTSLGALRREGLSAVSFEG